MYGLWKKKEFCLIMKNYVCTQKENYNNNIDTKKRLLTLGVPFCVVNVFLLFYIEFIVKLQPQTDDCTAGNFSFISRVRNKIHLFEGDWFKDHDHQTTKFAIRIFMCSHESQWRKGRTRTTEDQNRSNRDPRQWDDGTNKSATGGTKVHRSFTLVAPEALVVGQVFC